jgi:SAM-dependent methyltransferase
MEDLLNYTTLLEGAEEAAIKQIAEDDEMYNTGKEWYFSVGFDGLRAILNVLQISNVRSIDNILDLPCGHGRVGRYLRSAFPGAEMTFCDVNRSGVDYCARTFSGRGIYSQIELERVDLGGKFDLIWVGSLFTHIDYRRYKHWMEFLIGQLSPNGVLVVTLHGPGAIQFASKYPMLSQEGWNSILSQYLLTGFGYADYGMKHLEGYGISLGKVSKTAEIVENIPGIRLLSYTERGWGDNHDVIAVQKYDRSKPWP